MPIPPKLMPFWTEFSNFCGGADESRFCEAFYFGDSKELADGLAELVLCGVKGATAGAVWEYEAEGQRLPQPGDLSIVIDWIGSPKCVIETKLVEVMPFRNVTAEFAAAEGEGDGSLAFWREEHKRFFGRECAAAGIEFTENMLVVCQRFSIAYYPDKSAA